MVLLKSCKYVPFFLNPFQRYVFPKIVANTKLNSCPYIILYTAPLVNKKIIFLGFPLGFHLEPGKFLQLTEKSLDKPPNLCYALIEQMYQSAQKGNIAMELISQKQERVLTFICHFLDKHGYPPTVREICVGVGVTSPATVKHHLEKLTNAGYITIAPGKTRAITVVQQCLLENHVPVLGNVAAGIPILAEELIEEYLPFDTGGKQGEHFALRVRGDSMQDAGILEGDRVIIHRQETVQNGDIVVALFEDEATVKTYRRKEGKIWLLPENQDYDPIDGTYAKILGKVVGVQRTYD